MHSNDQEEQKPRQKKPNIRRIIHVICIIGFLCCVIWLIWYMCSLYTSRKQMEELLQNYITSSSDPVESSVPETTPEPTPVASTEPTPEPNIFGKLSYPDLTDYDVPEIDVDFEGLKELNSDVYAWIYVPDTKINYPVLQHPDDAEYYLSRDIEGNSSVGGCIFTQYYNSTDWQDNLTVIYGHNMGDRSMFGSLHNFEDSLFFDEHPYVYIYTPEYTLVYQVFAAYKFVDRPLLLGYTMNDPDSFEYYLQQVMDGEMTVDALGAHYNEDVELSADDRVLTLSTCVKNEAEHRYLVQAKLVAVGKTEAADEATTDEDNAG